MSLHILDRYTDKIKDFLTNKTDKKIVLDDLHTKNIESHTETYDFTVDYVASENIQPRDRVLIPDEEIGQYREFVVDDIEIDTYDGETQIKTVASYLEDLEKGRPIEPDKLDQYTTEQAVEYALTHVDWELGTIEYNGFRTISWTGVNSPFGILKIIANRFDLQLDFTIEIDGNEISRRLVHLREKTALFDGKEVRRGKDLENLKIQKSSTDVVTALLALAPEPEEGEERITLVVTDDEAQAQYGRERDYIWGVYEPESDDGGMTETRLRTLATTELNKRKQPKTDYSIDAVDLENFLGHEKVRIGDKIRIKDDLQEPLFYADATVKEVKRSVFNFLSKSYVLGDVTEYTKEDITKIFEQFRALLAKRMTEAQSNLDNIVTIIDTAVERKIFKQPNPPENPINSQLWLNTSNPDKPVLMEYFNGQWIVRISAVTDPEDIGAISRAEAMYEAILAALESFEVLHMQILTEANQIKLNKYLNQSNKDILDNRILAVVNTYNKLKAEVAKHKDTKAITLDEANHIQLLMLAYTDSIKALKEAITIATNYAMEHLAILQSQYSDEKYTEALEEVAGKFGMTVEDGKLIGDTVLLEDLNNTKTELQNQLDAAKETLLALESANTSNETSITTITQEITNLEGLIASKVSQSDYDLLDKTVTDMGTEVSQTAEAVSTKAEKSYVDTVKGTVENHSLSITEHAEGIDTLITKTNTHDGQITDVTNTATETAEGLAQTITKVTKAEGAITQAQADIVTNTKEIGTKLATATYTVDKEGIVGRLGAADSERTQLSNEIKDRVTITDYELDKTAQTGRISTLETSVTQNGRAITLKASQDDLDSVERTLSTKQSQLEVKATGIESSVKGLNDDLAQVKTSINQSIDGITQQVSANKKGITDANSKITQKADEINSEVRKKVGNDEIISRINQSAEKISINADRIELKAGSSIRLAIDDAVDGIEVGGRNYFAKSKAILSSSLRYDDSLDLYYNVGTSPSFSIFRMDSFGLELNQKYILAYEIKSNIPELGLRTNTYINGAVSSVNNNPELIKGEWVKVYTKPFLYHTETTASVHIYFNQYLASSRDIEIRNVQINRGTILQDYQEAPEDTEARIAQTNKELKDVKDSLSTFEGTITTSFKDGIIETAEAKAIKSHKAQLSKEKKDIDQKYTTIYANTRLAGTAKTNLLAAKTAFNTSHNSLISAIDKAIADGKATTAEYNTVLSGFGDYEAKLATLTYRFEEANDYIGSAKATSAETNAKTHADTAAKNAKEAAETYAKTKAEAERVLAEAHADGKVTAEEKARIADVNAKLKEAKAHADATSKVAEKAATDVANTKVAPSEIIPSINLDKSGAQIEGDRVNINANKINLSANEEFNLVVGNAQKALTDAKSAQTTANTAVSNASTAKSQADAARVGNNIAASLNLSGTTTAISGSKISLTGTAEFNSAFGSNRGITAIDGGRIETDSMRAKKVEIVRDDGAVSINDGKIRAEYGINAASPEFMSTNPTQNMGGHHFWQQGVWWTTNRSIQSLGTGVYGGRLNYFEFLHTSRYLRVALVMNVKNTGFVVRIRNSSGTINEATSLAMRSPESDSQYNVTRVLTADLGTPTYKRMNFYLYFMPNSQGGGADWAHFRIFHTMLTDEAEIPGWSGSDNA